MKKVLTYLVILCVLLMLFTSCASVNKADTSAAISQNDTTPANSAVEEPKKPVDSGLTLDGIKKSALDAGCEVEEVQAMQMSLEPKPVGGFNYVYKDENNQAHIPVLEFKNAADAEKYAKQVNEAGYNLCIINGKFLTMTSTKYGVVINENEKGALETLLNSKVMEYVESIPAPSNSSKDYAGAYSQIDAICKAIDKLVNKSALLHDKALPKDDPKRLESVFFSPLTSADLAFTAVLSEDQTQLDAVVKVWEMFGCTDVKLKHDVPNDYTLSGKRAGLDTSFELHCMYSPEKGSLRLVDKDGGQLVELYEFVPLGGDKYAFQTLYERGIVEYKDGKIISLIYSLNKRDKELAYDINKDSIYPSGQGTDEAWVSKYGEDSYEQSISYNGNTLKIVADSFMGGRLKAEMNVD